jgi:hypothetical protein
MENLKLKRSQSYELVRLSSLDLNQSGSHIVMVVRVITGAIYRTFVTNTRRMTYRTIDASCVAIKLRRMLMNTPNPLQCQIAGDNSFFGFSHLTNLLQIKRFTIYSTASKGARWYRLNDVLCGDKLGTHLPGSIVMQHLAYGFRRQNINCNFTAWVYTPPH